MGENVNVLATVDSTLAGKELKDQPRAFLCLRLSQLSLLFSPDKTEDYWNRLVPLQAKAPQELKPDLEGLRAVMESTARSGAKGFAAEVIADVEAAKQLAAENVEETKRRLQDCEARLNKRHWPFGKAQAYIALVEAWAGIDRRYALQLISTVPANVRENLIRRMNRTTPLAAEEWQIVADKAGLEQAVQIALKMLDDDQPRLLLPKKLVLEMGTRIRNAMKAVTTPQGEAELGKALTRYAKLIGLQVGSAQADLIPTLLEDLYVFLVESHSLDQIWTARFLMLSNVLELGVSTQALTGETLERLLAKTPAYMAGFVRAHYAGVTTSPEATEQVYTALLSKTGQDREAEAWFLVTLVKRGFGAEALALAGKSARSGELLPRLRRAWLCTHPESAGAAISPADMAGDPIGEFLAQGSVENRVAYLRQATDGGRRSVPGAMWAGKGTEKEAEGLRGFWKTLTSSKKTLDQILVEYLALNPVYSSYRRDTKKEEQFANYLRLSGYGEYRYADTDSTLLETLVAWGDQDAAQVRSVVRAMWNAIQPDDQILMADWLRNAILARCQNVITADHDVLLQDFLGWFKRELVDKGRAWQSGKTQYTLKYPDTAPFNFCVASAAAVNRFSPARRDQLLLSGLGKFKGDPASVDIAAQLYNSDKRVLDLTPPPPLKPNLVEAWQLGVVKNAIPSILQAMIAQAGK
jgi:hypothetical protein